MAFRYLLESGAPDGYQLEDGSGVLILEGAVVDLTAFGFYEDDDDVDNSTAIAAQSADISRDSSSAPLLHLRFLLQETNAATFSNVSFQLQSRLNAGSWLDVTTSATHVRPFDSLFMDESFSLVTPRLTGGTGTHTAGEVDEDAGLVALSIGNASGYTEALFAIELQDSALSDSDTLDFRLTESSAAVVGIVLTVEPTITIDKSGGTDASIAATETTDTASITAANWRTAQVAATESSDTAAITAANWTTAQVAAVETTDAASITADNWQTAQLAATESTDTAAITADVITTATIASVESSDIASITADNWTTAQISAGEGSDTASITADAGTAQPETATPGWTVHKNWGFGGWKKKEPERELEPEIETGIIPFTKQPSPFLKAMARIRDSIRDEAAAALERRRIAAEKRKEVARLKAEAIALAEAQRLEEQNRIIAQQLAIEIAALEQHLQQLREEDDILLLAA